MFVGHKLGIYLASGRRAFNLLVIAGFVGAVISTGCGKITTTPVDIADVDSGREEAGAGTTTDTTTTTTDTTTTDTPTTTDTTTASTGDDLNLSDVTTFILPAVPGVSVDTVRNAAVTAKINSASTNGKSLTTSYEKYSFPASDGTDAICYFFYRRGDTVMGGKFDWWRKGGQSVKTLENVHDGYGGHKMPASGTECWTMFSSKDGKQRSNTCKVTWTD